MSKRGLGLILAVGTVLGACGARPAAGPMAPSKQDLAPVGSALIEAQPTATTAPVPTTLPEPVSTLVITDATTVQTSLSEPQVVSLDDAAKVLPALGVPTVGGEALRSRALQMGDTTVYLATSNDDSVCVRFERSESGGSVCGAPRTGLVSGGTTSAVSPHHTIVVLAYSSDVSVHAELPCELKVSLVTDAIVLAACDVGTFVGELGIEFFVGQTRVATSVPIADYAAVSE